MDRISMQFDGHAGLRSSEWVQGSHDGVDTAMKINRNRKVVFVAAIAISAALFVIIVSKMFSLPPVMLFAVMGFIAVWLIGTLRRGKVITDNGKPQDISDAVRIEVEPSRRARASENALDNGAYGMTTLLASSGYKRLMYQYDVIVWDASEDRNRLKTSEIYDIIMNPTQERRWYVLYADRAQKSFTVITGNGIDRTDEPVILETDGSRARLWFSDDASVMRDVLKTMKAITPDDHINYDGHTAWLVDTLPGMKTNAYSVAPGK
jgi:hypothetical protein